jgi:uncharacterized protein
MNRRTATWVVLALSIMSPSALAAPVEPVQNRAPLAPRAYLELPLGSITPAGWLRDQLERQAKGMTGHLDERYAQVVGPRNGWLGGDGDGWERGPYWIDGLLPLAWLLDDEALKSKVRPWIEWSLTHAADDGYFGPIPFEQQPKPEPGIQKTPRRDWWPKMVMLKILQQYYYATGDERVVELMLDYFRYQLKTLPETPLDNWSFWANRRGGDNLMIVYWLYNITGESFLLELAELIGEQTFPWTTVFLNNDPAPSADLAHLYHYNTGNRYPFNMDLIRRLSLDQLQAFHCVNLAQGIKEPIIYYQQHPEQKYVDAVKQAFATTRRFHGQPQGMYGGDEPLHGPDPTYGVEFCSVVEMMFSLEKMLAITGDLAFADHLEKIAYNALPTQATDDFNHRQYFQAANQVMITRHRRNFYEDHGHGSTDLCYGLLNGYPCCTCNMHQGWPKFTQHLWFATPDRGLAALVYGPCEVSARVSGDQAVTLVEETRYPFEETVRFKVRTEKAASFPLHLRIPGWCKKATIHINDELHKQIDGPRMVKIERTWRTTDRVELTLPMSITTSRWVENSVAVERGPLVYALRIEEKWQWVKNADKHGDYWEVYPKSPWNFGLLERAVSDPGQGFEVVERQTEGYPWNLENAPVVLRTKGKRVPEWQLYNETAGPLPHSRPLIHLRDKPEEDITLVPYGCSTLRITEFPVVQ